MDPLEMLLVRYRNPARLGFNDATEVKRYLSSVVESVTPEDGEPVPAKAYNAALVQLIDLEISTLLGKNESVSISGQVSISTGLKVKLDALKAERATAARLAGLSVLKTGAPTFWVQL